MPTPIKLSRAISAFNYNVKQVHKAREYQRTYGILDHLARRAKHEDDKYQKQGIEDCASNFIESRRFSTEQTAYFLLYFIRKQREY